jgi:hypothetical protein
MYESVPIASRGSIPRPVDYRRHCVDYANCLHFRPQSRELPNYWSESMKRK